MKKYKYLLLIFLGGCLWGTMGFFRRRMDGMGFDSTGVVFSRCAVASVMFAVMMLIRDPSQFKVRLKDFPILLGSGIVSLFFFSFSYFQAMQLMSLSAAAILLYTAPVFVMLMAAALFKEKITGRKLIAMCLCFCGCCLVSGIAGGIRLTAAGLAYGLCAGFGYALYSIFGKLAMKRGYGSITINFWSCLLAALAAGVAGGFGTPVGIIVSSASSFGFIVLTALVTTFLPYLLYTEGLTEIEAGTASVVASIEPVVATVVGVTVFSEKLTPIAVAGMLMVLAAIVILSRNEQPKQPSQPG